jgi:(1->4)-alpha-D-glucan 1-alpha-D-glucosylmutase
VEDTAFYRYARLLALNDVGGDPGRFSIPVERFHAANAERAVRFPRNLLITQTHDTKRAGDVRARIGALSGMAEAWAGRVRRWFELNAPLRSGGAPDAVEEYVVYQTLVGAWPIEADRLGAYMEKALREAKRNTSWVDQDSDYEARVRAFCRALYEHGPFLEDFEPFAARVAEAGRAVVLRQLLLQLTAPGIPDIYQGDELESLSLVDPDNRRPVDWERRRALLGDPAEPKLSLIRRALALRARRPDAFAGAYEPLDAGERTCAYLRGGEVLVAVGVRSGWEADRLRAPAGRWHDVLSGTERELEESEPLSRLLDDRGLALLER